MISLTLFVLLMPAQNLDLGGPEAEKLKNLIATGGIGRRAKPKPLGSLSKKYEVSNGGPETISSGKIYDKKSKKLVDDPGGVSYGTYQFASQRGIGGSTLKAFVAKYFAKEFKGLEIGSKQFDERWVKTVLKDVVKFRQIEHEFVKTTHYDPVIAEVKTATGLDAAKRSKALQDVLWSTAVQHGPPADAKGHAVPLVEKALVKWTKEELAKTVTPTDMPADTKQAGQPPVFAVDDAQVIAAIYAERDRKRDDGKMVYFPSLSELPRFKSEKADALKMLETERALPAKTPAAKPKPPNK